MSTYRIAVIGLVHDHVWKLLDQFVKDPRAELVAAADANPPLLERAAREAGIDAHFSDVDELLDASEPDALLVCTENARAAGVVSAAAARGVHAMVEKPMAATLAQADAMLLAARQHGTTLMINWPNAWNPGYRWACRQAQEGRLGHVWQVRYHSAHEGPKELGCSEYFYSWLYDKELNGAGALMDYCCYGAATCAWLLGRPGSVTGVAGRLVKEDMAVDDNAVLLLKYEKAIGINEASWTQFGRMPYGLLINGTEGAVAVDTQGTTLVDKEHRQGTSIEPPLLSETEANGPACFLTCLEEGREPEGICNAVTARNAQEILEAGIIAAETGTSVPLPLLTRR